jgi:hypothetical protein
MTTPLLPRGRLPTLPVKRTVADRQAMDPELHSALERGRADGAVH